MRYVAARVKQEKHDRAYRIYITDALFHIGGLNTRYADIIYPQNSRQEEEKTADGVISNIKNKFR